LKLVQSKKNEFSIMLVATDEALLQKSFSHIGLSKPWKDDCTKPAAVLHVPVFEREARVEYFCNIRVLFFASEGYDNIERVM
jgi:hypothetical protein